jgi:phage gpG-like protein
MATIKDIDEFFDKLTDEFLKNQVSIIIAEEATAFFKERFTTKEWDGEPWQETKVPIKRGTLMVRSSALMNSIKPKTVTSERVIISGGSDKVPYAKAHNEGETISIPITPKMRKFAWAKYYEEAGKGIKKGKKGNEYQSIDVGKKANPWKGLALTKKQTLTVKMPLRRFMGHSEKLNDRILEALRVKFNSL